MQQLSEENEIFEHFASAGDLYASETEVLGAVIRKITAQQGFITKKAIILSLLAKMEATVDVVEQDILRKTLELVVGITPDDPDV
ncbi:transcriptional regulator [Rouxiella sp. S1S-2]|uniref:biofilm development regulator YmgB/AriR family protein n=1 Tax=Rouxiella sp. S1S-2 TaxID=2653856 RepID=UPI001264175D|nr:biofilm development regulator YmgB/AriR family protein [Rouxiella sp. S1S-2]KAB7897142.1 transcriptional regulator [Rouxiella sp. S1S-2]